MASANTLTGLIPVMMEAADIVSREMVGFIPAVDIDAESDGVAEGQTVRVPIVPAAGANVTITPGTASGDTGGVTVSYIDMSISKSKMQPVAWSGVDQKGLKTNGPGKYEKIMIQRFAQAMRALVNEIEVDLATAAYQGASRAYGIAGTTPFASSHADVTAQIRKILDDNGCPGMERSLIIDSAAGANLRSLTGLNTVYAAGTDATLRQGTLLGLNGFDVKESAGIVSHTKGAGTGYVIVAAGEDAGQTTISLDGGTVNTSGIKAGDIVTLGTGGGSGTGTDYDTKYVVNTGLTAVSGNIVIGNPGLKVARVNDDAMTVGASYKANVAFHRQALKLLARTPELPEEGDLAEDVTYITDPLSGLTFQICMYKQYKQVHYEVGIAWGVKCIKSEHVAVLLG
jgi:hypothetical protein